MQLEFIVQLRMSKWIPWLLFSSLLLSPLNRLIIQVSEPCVHCRKRLHKVTVYSYIKFPTTWLVVMSNCIWFPCVNLYRFTTTVHFQRWKISPSSFCHHVISKWGNITPRLGHIAAIPLFRYHRYPFHSGKSQAGFVASAEKHREHLFELLIDSYHGHRRCRAILEQTEFAPLLSLRLNSHW